MAKKESAAPVVPDADTETLQLVAAAKGPAVALAELESHIGQCKRQIEDKVSLYRQGTRSFEATLTEVGRLLDAARQLGGRLATLRSIAGQADAPDPGIDELGERVVCMVVATEADGRRFTAALDTARGDLEDELASLNAEIAATQRRFATQPQNANRGPLDGALIHDPGNAHEYLFGELHALVTRRRTVQRVLDSLNRDEGTRSTAQGKAVAGAIDAAGGPDRIGAGVRDAKLLDGEWWVKSPRFAELTGLGTQLDEARRKATALGGLDPASHEPGTLGFQLATKAAALAQQLDELRATVDADERKGVAELIADAIAGDESSRAYLLDVVQKHPEAFADGLAAALESAACERSPIAALCAALDLRAARGAEAQRRQNEKARQRRAMSQVSSANQRVAAVSGAIAGAIADLNSAAAEDAIAEFTN